MNEEERTAIRARLQGIDVLLSCTDCYLGPTELQSIKDLLDPAFEELFRLEDLYGMSEPA